MNLLKDVGKDADTVTVYTGNETSLSKVLPCVDNQLGIKHAISWSCSLFSLPLLLEDGWQLQCHADDFCLVKNGTEIPIYTRSGVWTIDVEFVGHVANNPAQNSNLNFNTSTDCGRLGHFGPIDPDCAGCDEKRTRRPVKRKGNGYDIPPAVSNFKPEPKIKSRGQCDVVGPLPPSFGGARFALVYTKKSGRIAASPMGTKDGSAGVIKLLIVEV